MADIALDTSFGWWKLPVAVGLSALSATFAGLTLGLMTLDILQLRVLIECGSTGNATAQRYAKFARAILIIRKNGNFLLVTLLILNVAVNSAFSILVGEATSGLIGFLISTTVLTLFGEIVPQAVFSRFALPLCYWFVPLVVFCEVLLAPIAWPLAAILNAVLGSDIGKTYTREQLAQLIRHHSMEAKVLGCDEGQIVRGGLFVGTKKAADAMTSIDSVFGIDDEQILSGEVLRRMITSGYSRFPVFKTGDSKVVRGFLYIKDLVLVNPADHIKARDAVALFGRALFAVDVSTPLLTLLNFFKAGKSHIAVVRRTQFTGDKAVSSHCGIITLEDIIEEILQDEILDEFDVPLSSEKGSVTAPDVAHIETPSLDAAVEVGIAVRELGDTSLQPSKSFIRAKMAARQEYENDTNLRIARMQLLYDQTLGSHLTFDQAQLVLNFLNSSRLFPFSKARFYGETAIQLLVRTPLTALRPAERAECLQGHCAILLQGTLCDRDGIIGAWTVVNYQTLVSNRGYTIDREPLDPSMQVSIITQSVVAGSRGCVFIPIYKEDYDGVVDR